MEQVLTSLQTLFEFKQKGLIKMFNTAIDIHTLIMNIELNMSAGHRCTFQEEQHLVDQLDALCQPIIVIINGTGGSGKDTVVGIAKRLMEIACPSVHLYNESIIVPIAESIRGLTGLAKNAVNPEDIEKYRNLLANAKVLLEDYDPNSLQKILLDKIIKDCTSNYLQLRHASWHVIDGHTIINTSYLRELIFRPIVFVHMRAPFEIDSFKSKLADNGFHNVYTLLVTGRVDPSTHSNDADCNVENYSYNFTINNNSSTQHLIEEVRNVLRLIYIPLFNNVHRELDAFNKLLWNHEIIDSDIIEVNVDDV